MRERKVGEGWRGRLERKVENPAHSCFSSPPLSRLSSVRLSSLVCRLFVSCLSSVRLSSVRLSSVRLSSFVFRLSSVVSRLSSLVSRLSSVRLSSVRLSSLVSLPSSLSPRLSPLLFLPSSLSPPPLPKEHVFIKRDSPPICLQGYRTYGELIKYIFPPTHKPQRWVQTHRIFLHCKPPLR
jgi:hypothetical protein